MNLKNIFTASILALACFLVIACTAIEVNQRKHQYNFDMHGTIDFELAEQFRKFISSVPEGANVQIHIESGGGLLAAHYKIIHYLLESKARITCTVDTYSASAAANIFMLCPSRVILDHSVLVFHVIQYCASFIGDNCQEMVPVSPTYRPDLYIKSIEMLTRVIKPYLTPQQWQVLLNSEDLYVYGKYLNDKFKELDDN